MKVKENVKVANFASLFLVAYSYVLVFFILVIKQSLHYVLTPAYEKKMNIDTIQYP